MALLKQLYEQVFPEGEEVTATSFKENWMKFASEFKFSSGEDSQAKWDVFAECFTRLPIEEQLRFVDYKSVEYE